MESSLILRFAPTSVASAEVQVSKMAFSFFGYFQFTLSWVVFFVAMCVISKEFTTLFVFTSWGLSSPEHKPLSNLP
jgi:hypothetical protein